jgi:riboflavin synthase
MFTGLVQATGRVQRSAQGVRLRFATGEALAPLALGDSVAVDGVCLTVAELFSDGFRADVSGETLERSTLAAKSVAAAAVNLEAALRLGDRVGGHLVSGHVDGAGVVTAIEREPTSWRLSLAWIDPAYGRYVCDKASVAVDGISLTVAGCDPDGVRFEVAVIPHTWTLTTLGQRRVGDRVNLEADLLAKYTERLLRAGPVAAAVAGREEHREPLSTAWLAEQGW